MVEQLFTTAPDRVIDKQDTNFEQERAAHRSDPTAQLPLT